MKCIQIYGMSGPAKDRIQRVTDAKADELVKKGQALYIPKRFWKAKVRDVKEQPSC